LHGFVNVHYKSFDACLAASSSAARRHVGHLRQGHRGGGGSLNDVIPRTRFAGQCVKRRHQWVGAWR
jgi:hypothetical protein